MKLSKEEILIEKIALILLSSKIMDSVSLSIVINEAHVMASRAMHEYWTLPGRPYFNKRMAHLKRQLKKCKK